MLGRRKFLGTVGATAVAVGAWRKFGRPAGVANGGSAAPTAGLRTSVSGADEVRLLASAGLVAGVRFGTCEVRGVDRTTDGAVSVRLLDGSGQHFEVELLQHDPLTPGVARAGSLGVYMNNRGRGTAATIEEHGLAAMALARKLARGEASGTKLPSCRP